MLKNTITIIVFFCFFLSPLHAADLDDVIYLNNGSVIRGIIIEQRPKDGVYKIQSEGGNIFVYKTDEIEKVTKEPKINGLQNGININIVNNNTNTNIDEEKENNSKKDTSRRHAIGMSSWGLSRENRTSGDKAQFQGGAITYQYGLNDHIATRINIYSATHEDVSSLKASGLDVQLILTSNARNSGFKFYIGAGYFSEKWENDSAIIKASLSYSGAEGVFGFGYNWNRVGLDLAGAVRPKSSYDETADVLYVTGALRITYRY